MQPATVRLFEQVAWRVCRRTKLVNVSDLYNDQSDIHGDWSRLKPDLDIANDGSPLIFFFTTDRKQFGDIYNAIASLLSRHSADGFFVSFFDNFRKLLHHGKSQSAAAAPSISKVTFDVHEREAAKCRLIDERIDLCDRLCFPCFAASKALWPSSRLKTRNYGPIVMFDSSLDVFFRCFYLAEWNEYRVREAQNRHS